MNASGNIARSSWGANLLAFAQLGVFVHNFVASVGGRVINVLLALLAGLIENCQCIASILTWWSAFFQLLVDALSSLDVTVVSGALDSVITSLGEVLANDSVVSADALGNITRVDCDTVGEVANGRRNAWSDRDDFADRGSVVIDNSLAFVSEVLIGVLRLAAGVVRAMASLSEGVDAFSSCKIATVISASNSVIAVCWVVIANVSLISFYAICRLAFVSCLAIQLALSRWCQWAVGIVVIVGNWNDLTCLLCWVIHASLAVVVEVLCCCLKLTASIVSAEASLLESVNTLSVDCIARVFSASNSIIAANSSVLADVFTINLSAGGSLTRMSWLAIQSTCWWRRSVWRSVRWSVALGFVFTVEYNTGSSNRRVNCLLAVLVKFNGKSPSLAAVIGLADAMSKSVLTSSSFLVALSNRASLLQASDARLNTFVSGGGLDASCGVAFACWRAVEVALALFLVWNVLNNTLLFLGIVLGGLALEMQLGCKSPLLAAGIVLAQVWAL